MAREYTAQPCKASTELTRMKYLIAILSVLLLTHSLQAQTDTAFYNKESARINENLDSMMDLWYVKKAKTNFKYRYNNKYGFKPTDVPQYSDSVYDARIATIDIESPIPYTFNRDVKGFIDLYGLKKREQVSRMLGLSEYYFPYFEQVLEKKGMPHELKYLAVVESALNPTAVSSAGAVGMWQFMYYTGKMYDLNINSYVDDRRDPYLATEAAANYLSDAYDLFGDWFLAIASYNCGAGNVRKAIRRSGGKRTFWEIYPYLPRETRGYVPAFIAASYIFKYNREHNIYPVEIHIPLAVDTVKISEEISFAPIAQVLDVDIQLLRDLNPQFKRDFIPARVKPYVLRLPSTKAWAFCTMKDSIYICYNKERGGDLTTTTTQVALRAPTPAASATNSNNKLIYHTVRKGDVIGQLADKYHVSTYSIKRWNNLRSNTIYLNQKLKIYVPQSSSYAKSTTPPTVTSTDGISYYTVKRGDTLYDIAKRFPGISAADIQKANSLGSSNKINVGQKLKIVKS